MTGLDHARVAEVIVALSDRPGRRGSGYRLAGTAVLTAAHVVDAATSVTVRFEADREEEWTAEATVEWFDPVTDTAILTIAAQDDVPETRYGVVPLVNTEVRCSTVGFPLFKLRTDRSPGPDGSLSQYRDSCHRFGWISPFSNSRERTLEIRIDDPERDPDPRRSPWEGMSGAAVFVDDRLVGVIRSHDRHAGLGVLTATSLDQWYGDPTRVVALRRFIALPDELPDSLHAPAGVTPSREVLLSYFEEQGSAEQLADELATHGLQTVLQRRRATPGVPVGQAIQTALTRTEAVALLVGASGLGPWHATDLRTAYDEAVRRRGNVRMVTVLLPGSAELPPGSPDGPTIDLRQYLLDPGALAALVAFVQGRAQPAPHRVRLPDDPAPYPSLRAFTLQDARHFFGRSKEIRDLFDRVSQRSFTAVFGASGAGKSSLVMAGLLPLVEPDWHLATMVPGEEPLQALEALRLDEPRDRTVLLVIDQFEEVFTHARKPQTAFIAAVCRAAHQDAGIRIVITLRADFFEACLDHPDLRELLQHNQLLLGALDEPSLREAVLLPAQSAGAVFERGLVDRVVADMRGRSGALPLLQTALAQLWQRRRGVWLTHEDYNDIHGIGGALNQLADQLYRDLSPHQQELTRSLFLRLVTIGDNSTLTRRRARREEFDFVCADATEIDRLLRALSSQSVRLVSIDRETVELTHEALIDGWETLRGWLRQDEVDLRTHRILTEDARRWEDEHRDDSYLYQGIRLAAAFDWAQRHTVEVSRLEEAFLAASRTRAEIAVREASERTVGRAGQSVFQLESSPEDALRLALEAAGGGLDNPLVQRAIFRVQDTARIQRILRGHSDRISSVAWHPSGDLLATGSYDNTVHLWEVATGATSAVLAGHSNSVTCVAFDHTGERLASGSWDNSARIWDVRSGRTVAVLEGHEQMVSSVAWSPSGRYLATGSQDRTGRIWDVTTGQVRAVLKGHEDWVRSVEWHPDETRVLTGSYDHTAKLWKVPDAVVLATLRGHDGPVPAVTWSPDGAEALTASEDGTIQLWNMADETSVRRIRVHTSPTYCVALRAGGRLAATGSEDGNVRVFDVDTGTRELVLPGHTGWVSSVGWSPDGSRIASGSEDGTARITSHDGGFTSTLIAHETGWVSSATWHPGSHLFATAGQAGVTIRAPIALEEWSLDSENTLTVSWSPSGRYLACGSWAGTLSIYDTATWTVVGAAESDVDSDLTGEQDGRISAIAWAPNEAYLATASYGGTARVWEVDTLEEVARAEFNTWVVDVAWSPEGDRVVIASWQNDAHVWDTSSRAGDSDLLPLSGHTTSLHACDWSRDGRLIVTSSGDGTARLWHPETRDQVALLRTGEAHTAAFNPVRLQVATGSRDGGLRLWNVSEGADLLVVFEHSASVLAAAWRPDGEQILTGTEDGQIRLWPTPGPETVVATIQQRVSDLFPDR